MYMTSDRRPWTSDLGTRTFDRGLRTTLPSVKVALDSDPDPHADSGPDSDSVQIQIQIQMQIGIASFVLPDRPH